MGGGSHCGVPFFVAEAIGGNLGQSFCGRRIRGRDAAVDAIIEPLSDAAEIEGNGRQAEASGFETHESERLRPHARNEQQVSLREDAVPRVGRKPAGEFNGESRNAKATLASLLSQPILLTAVADDRERDGSIEAVYEIGSGVDGDVDALHALEA